MQTAIISENLSESSPLYRILMAQELVPGSQPSYEICKDLYLFHPLGKKIVDAPVNKSMQKKRDILVTDDISEEVVRRFNDVWSELKIDSYIANTHRLARIYGVASVAVIPADGNTTKPLTPDELYSTGTNIKFSVFDPLNTAGSMVGILDPNDPEFLKYSSIAVNGVPYARSRTHIQLNEQPVYLSFTSSAFGYVGRSVFNRALYPLQSFLSSMITDNLVMIKSGVLVAKVKQPGSISDRVMSFAQKVRLNVLKQARTGNTISVMPDESIESLDLHNLDYAIPRKNILENIALSLDMPPSFLTGESLSQGFGEGSEDAKLIAGYIDSIRLDLNELYEFFDNIVQYIAWSPEYFETLKATDDNYKGVDYQTWFNRARDSFQAIWPPALEPTKKELVLYQKEKYKSVLEVYKTLRPEVEGENLGKLIDWATTNLNESKEIFPNALHLDIEAIENDEALQQQHEMGGELPEQGGSSSSVGYPDSKIKSEVDRPTVGGMDV